MEFDTDVGVKEGPVVAVATVTGTYVSVGGKRVTVDGGVPVGAGVVATGAQPTRTKMKEKKNLLIFKNT
jgi:hypothetical protein